MISVENKLAYICSDYNFDLLKHDSDSKINDFLTNFLIIIMFPLIDRPTRITSHSATLLENIFTNVFDNKIKSGVCVSDITDHYPIFQITSSLSIKNRPCRTNYSRSFTQCNMRTFVNRIELVDWNDIISVNSVNQAYSLFLDKLANIYDHCFPVRCKNINVGSNCIPRKPWITSAILTSVRRKNKLFIKFKSSPTDSNKLLLANYRNKLTNLIHVSKKNYYCNFLDTHKHNLKQTWQILNDFLGRRRKSSFPECFNISGTVSSNFKTIADGVNNLFLFTLAPDYPIPFRIRMFRQPIF